MRQEDAEEWKFPEGVIESIGQGLAARYCSTIADRILGETDLDAYFSAEIDEREICELINFQLITDKLPRGVDLCCNALLLAHRFCPLSFRPVHPSDNKKALLLFYERNNLSAIKAIFLRQVLFAVENYF